MNTTGTVYGFKAQRLGGDSYCLSEFEGQVLLVVNTASQCGFTPQYEGLQALEDQFSSKGFHVLGFPCNQFGKQEPGSSQDIAEFCTSRFSVSFPMHEKVDVNGDNAHPLFRFLKESLPGVLGSEAIKWNFTKFLVDAHGRPVKRFGSSTAPSKVAPEIASLLGD